MVKKVIGVLLVFGVCLCISGCKLLEVTAEYVANDVKKAVTAIPEAFNEIKEDYQYLDELSAEIVRCFDEKDAEGLKALFCTNELENNTEIDSQIETTFSMYEGKSQSFYTTDKSWEGGYRNGVYDEKYFTPRIRITTSDGKEYTISYALCTIYEYDKGKIGINALGLSDDWPNELAGIGLY